MSDKVHSGEQSERRIGSDGWDEAIADAEGPQLVVAGPGTGKTEFLVRRAIHLIAQANLPAEHLLVLTFSRRAAFDLRTRIERGVGRSTAGIPASTFHSFAHRLLETHAGRCLGWTRLRSLLTGPEQVELVAELLAGDDAHAWPAGMRDMLTTRTFARDVTDFLLRTQERLLGPEALAGHAAGRDDWRRLPDFLARYQEELAARHRIDYGTLLAEAVKVLDDPGTREELARQYRFVLVDEYQDTTAAQARLLERLTAHHRCITAAADPYQSVYSFRGAELRNVADFPQRFIDLQGRPARRLVLTSSFRVPPDILAAAERLTAAGELPGAAGPVRPADHRGRVDVHTFDQHTYEAEWIASEVQRLHVEDRVPYASMAVLVRTRRRLLQELSRALERRSVPHDRPDSRLADHPAVQLIVDCVVAAVGDEVEAGPTHRTEADRAIRRLLLGPLFDASLTTERELLRRRTGSGLRWADLLDTTTLDGGAALASLLRDPAWAEELPAAEGFWHLWTHLPHLDRLVAEPQAEGFRAAWSSLAQALERQAERDRSATLADWVRSAAEDTFEANPLLSYRREGGDRLTLTTLHQAKGLEFDVVIIADAVEGVFPDVRRSQSVLRPELLAPERAEDPLRFRLQEEMRLAYTAMTRARSRVVWTATTAGIEEQEGRPSRFLPAVAGVASVEELGPPPPRTGPPVTAREAEAWLRTVLIDPEEPAARRLAALKVLVSHPNPVLRSVDRFALVRRPGTDTGLVGADLTLSPSQADSYRTCPRRYAFERRLHIGDSAGAHARFGTLIHRVLEEVERAARDRGEQRSTLEQAKERLADLIDPAEFGGPGWGRAWRMRGEKLLERLYGEWPQPDARPALLEHQLEMQIGGIVWRGIADRIEDEGQGTLRVVDYKTGTSSPTKQEAAASLQLGFYLAAARRDPEVVSLGEPAHAEFWYPMSRGNPIFPYDPGSLDTLEEELVAIADGIAAEHWEAKVNERCDRCTVRIVCPKWPEGREAYVR